MIPLAPNNYSVLTKFDTPWEFYIKDNFLPDKLYNSLLKIKEQEKHYKFVDQTIDNGKGISSTEYGDFPKKKSIGLSRDTRLTSEIAEVVESSIKPLLPEKYFVVPDLVRCDPGYVYGKHKDHPLKYISIVVFLHPERANGTTLYGNNDKAYTVGWKRNRAFIFLNSSHGYHYYTNTTNNRRFTLNIYVTTKPNTSFEVWAPLA